MKIKITDHQIKLIIKSLKNFLDKSYSDDESICGFDFFEEYYEEGLEISIYVIFNIDYVLELEDLNRMMLVTKIVNKVKKNVQPFLPIPYGVYSIAKKC